MRRDTRAIIFDLDDTLYPLETFVLSGFDAVATRLRELFGVDSETARSVMRHARGNGQRGQELQTVLRYFDLPDALVPMLVDVIRLHEPSIELTAGVATTIGLLSAEWRVGIVTNGLRPVQARKIAALGVQPLVDTIVFADPVAKPQPAPFLEAADRLGVPPHRAVFVGDDAVCDVYGAWRLGMKTIHIAGNPAQRTATVADASVRSLLEVPDIAEKLVA